VFGRRLPFVVHLAAALVDHRRGTLRAIDGRFAGLEFLALLHERA